MSFACPTACVQVQALIVLFNVVSLQHTIIIFNVLTMLVTFVCYLLSRETTPYANKLVIHVSRYSLCFIRAPFQNNDSCCLRCLAFATSLLQVFNTCLVVESFTVRLTCSISDIVGVFLLNHNYLYLLLSLCDGICYCLFSVNSYFGAVWLCVCMLYVCSCSSLVWFVCFLFCFILCAVACYV